MVPLIAPLSNFRSKTASPPLCMGPFHLPVTSAANTKVESKITTSNVGTAVLGCPAERSFATKPDERRAICIKSPSKPTPHREENSNQQSELLAGDRQLLFIVK